MAILAIYYATPEVDKEHKNAFSELKSESSSPVITDAQFGEEAVYCVV